MVKYAVDTHESTLMLQLTVSGPDILKKRPSQTNNKQNSKNNWQNAILFYRKDRNLHIFTLSSFIFSFLSLTL